MAGEWIKMEACTPDKAEVLAITARMGWDDPDLTVGKLFRIWRWFDQHTTDGNADGVTFALLDRIVGVSGFCSAMQSVGWLVAQDAGVTLPNFDRHNGNTSKNRALTAKRVANHKANAKANATGNADTVSDALPREEKKRKEKKDISPEVVPTSGPVSGFAVPLVDGSDFDVPQRMLDDWATLFPAVDVQQELREMRAWSLANKAKRKTRRGVEAFIVRWLSKAQDTPGRPRTVVAVDEQRSSMFAGCI